MSNDDRFEKAKRLAALTDSGQGYFRGSKQTVDPDSPRGKHEARMEELHIELRAKHMTSEQLDAMLNFYDSDMGKSIVEAQERIREEMSSILASSLNNSSAKGISVPKPKKSSDGDT